MAFTFLRNRFKQFSIIKAQRMCLEGKVGGTGPWPWNMRFLGPRFLAPLYVVALPWYYCWKILIKSGGTYLCHFLMATGCCIKWHCPLRCFKMQRFEKTNKPNPLRWILPHIKPGSKRFLSWDKCRGLNFSVKDFFLWFSMWFCKKLFQKQV